MKKLKFFITSAIICTCIFSLSGCKNNVESYTFNGSIIFENELANNVSVLVNGVNAFYSIDGKVNLTNLSKGDIITFYKKGYICNDIITIDKNINNYEVHLHLDGFKKVNVISSVDVDFDIVDYDNGNFNINFDVPNDYFFTGYYIDDILISKDKNFLFNNDYRGDIETKFAVACNVKLFKSDCSLIEELVVPKNSIVSLDDYVNYSRVFVGWKCNGEIVSTDINFSPQITEDTTFYLIDEIAYIDYVVEDRTVDVHTNTTFDVYINNELKLTNQTASCINIAKLYQNSGTCVVKLVNNQYNLCKEFTVNVVNDYTINNANIIKYNDRFFVVVPLFNTDYRLSIKVDNKVVNDILELKSDLYYVDVTDYIIDGTNTLQIATVDIDNIVSKYVSNKEYHKQYNLPIPKFMFAKNRLYITNNNSYNAYLVVNGIIKDKIIDNVIDISKCNNTKLGIMFCKDFANFSYANIDFYSNVSSSSNNKFIKIEEYDNGVNLFIDTTGKTNIKVQINGIDCLYDLSQININITDYLFLNANNIITVTYVQNGSKYSTNYCYYYRGIFNINFDVFGTTICIENYADYYKIYLNNVELSNKFTTNQIDINSYILSSNYIDIKVEGYVDNVLTYSNEEQYFINKTNFVKENISVVKSTNKYLFIDKINDAKYYLNDILITSNAIKINDLANSVLKIVLNSGKVILYDIN